MVVYDDATGVPLRPGDTLQGHPTIGWGRALDVKGLSQYEADELLRRDLLEAARIAEDFARYAIGTVRRAVLIDMAHNLGRHGLFGFKQLRLALDARDFAHAADEMLNSRWATQVGARARHLAELMRTDKA